MRDFLGIEADKDANNDASAPDMSPSSTFSEMSNHRGDDDEECKREIKEYDDSDWEATQFVSTSNLQSIYDCLACFAEENGLYKICPKSYKITFTDFEYTDANEDEHQISMKIKILKVPDQEKYVVQV